MKTNRRIAWAAVELAIATMFLCVVATAQPKLTPQQERDAAKLQTLVETELLRRASEEALAKAQAIAVEREARMKTSAPVEREVVRPIPQPVKIYVDTNAMGSNLGTFIEEWDKRFPGFATNFTAEQRAMKSTRPIIRSKMVNGRIVDISTNYPTATGAKAKQ